MDPISQGVIGATATQVISTRTEKFIAAMLGFFTGMSPDLDVLIRSSTDPLLALEYHRHFTHSLVFIPLGALLCATVFYFLIPSLKIRLNFTKTFLFCLAGYATHPLLDACTTYGTQLFWPFSDARVAWNNVSVIDPIFTLPLIILVLFTIIRRSNKIAFVAFVYAFAYLGLGYVQNQRAEVLALQLAASRGHTPINLGVKPSLANLITWKSVYEYEERYYIDAVRVLVAHRYIKGQSIEKLNVKKHFPWLKLDTQQAKDIERFRWFSNSHLAIDPQNSNRIIDVRYSFLPNQVTGMWGISLDETASTEEHVVWSTTRPNSEKMPQYLRQLWAMLKP